MPDRTETPAPPLTIDEVAETHRVSRRTVERWIAKGQLPATKLPGGSVRIERADSEALRTPAGRTDAGEKAS